MDTPTQFWGVEVKIGQSVKVVPDDQYKGYIRISQVSLGEVKKDKATEPVVLYLKIGDRKLVLGTLIKDSIPQIYMDIVLDEESELSHNSKNASVCFSGLKVACDDDDDGHSSDSEPEFAPWLDFDSEPEFAPWLDFAPDASKAQEAAKPGTEDESDSEFSASQIPKKDFSEWYLGFVLGGSEEETDAEEVDQGKNKKRTDEAGSQTPVPSKKAKNAAPEKTDDKKGVLIATPHPMKNGGKTPQGAAKNKTPSSNKPATSKIGQQNKESKQCRR